MLAHHLYVDRIFFWFDRGYHHHRILHLRTEKAVVVLYQGVFPRLRYIFDIFLGYAQFLLILQHSILPFCIFILFYMSSELNLKQIHRIFILQRAFFLVPDRGSEPYWYGSTVLHSIYTVKLANSASPSKFRQVKFSLKTGLKNDKTCFSHLSLNTIKQFFWKPQFVILKTSF